MRKRSLAPTYWTDRSFEDDQPAFYNSFKDLKSLDLEDDRDEYDYKWDRYDQSWDNVVENPSPRYQKRSRDGFKRAKAAREWYTRLG